MSDPARHFQIFECLQTNDLANVKETLPKLLAPAEAANSQAKGAPSYGTPLHLAVAFCSTAICEWIVKTYCGATDGRGAYASWVNTPNVPERETPLHLAAKRNRADVVPLLLAVPALDDTLRTAAGAFADDLTTSERVRELVRAHREKFRVYLVSLVNSYISTNDTRAIMHLFETNARALAYLQLSWFDLNAPLESTHEHTLLHLAAKREDLDLVNWCLRMGADPSARDRKGVRPAELVPKKGNAELRQRLKLAVHQSPIVPFHSAAAAAAASAAMAAADASAGDADSLATASGPPSGPVGPSEHRAGAGAAIAAAASSAANLLAATALGDLNLPIPGMRRSTAGGGSGAASSATLPAAGTIAAPAGPLAAGGPAPALRGILQKWTNYASGYKNRYFVLESGALSYYRSESEYPQHCKGSLRADILDVHPDQSEKARFDIVGRGIKYQLRARSQAEAKRWMWALVESRQWVLDRAKVHGGAAESPFSAPNLVYPVEEEDPSESLNDVRVGDTGSGGGDEEAVSPSSPVAAGKRTGPSVLPALPEALREEMENVQFSMRTELDIVAQAVEACVATGAPPTGATPGLLRASVGRISGQATRLGELVRQREAHWQRAFRREFERRKYWEEVIKRMVDAEVEMERSQAVVAPKAAQSSEEDYDDDTSDDERADADDNEVFFDAEAGPGPGGAGNGIEELLGFEALGGNDDAGLTLSRASRTTRVNMAIDDSGASARMVVSSTTKDGRTLVRRRPVYGMITLQMLRRHMRDATEAQLSGLAPLFRDRLPLPADAKKPSLSVWSFLKSAIGKDLSKVTLPVFFNEPLTMLQRFAEEMEYSAQLSLASRVGSRAAAPAPGQPLDVAQSLAAELGWPYADLVALSEMEARMLRLMLVTGFAMSSYASTVGRNNKPFNPMLGETYELVSLKQQFRYLSEQVCHHPPITAAFAESPDFCFWGEVNVKSKFWGRSLEVHPLGNNHVRLPIFAAGDSQPLKTVGTEHYTWKKVVVTVNGLMSGRLWITNTGDTVVRNWRTGDEATLTFKKKEASGWFAGGGAEDGDGERDLVGTVRDATGRVWYTLEGRWDRQLVAKPAPGVRPLFGLAELPLWRVHSLPAHSAQQFNFTSFAMALNDLPASLRNVLPPTDSRLRPDCRALEEARWDDADRVKNTVETVQRDRRKLWSGYCEQTQLPCGPPAQFLGGDPGNEGTAWTYSHLAASTPKLASAAPEQSPSSTPPPSPPVGAGEASEPPTRELEALDIGETWWQPRWFVRERDPDSNEEHWRFTREYWTFRGERGDNSSIASATASPSSGAQASTWPSWVLPIFDPPVSGEVERATSGQ